MMKSQKSLELDLKKFPREEALTLVVKRYLSSQRDIYWYKASDRYNKGVSDILCCINGRFVGIELKAENGKPTAHQLLFINSVVEAGGIAAVCYTLGEVKALVEKARCS